MGYWQLGVYLEGLEFCSLRLVLILGNRRKTECLLGRVCSRKLAHYIHNAITQAHSPGVRCFVWPCKAA